MYRAYLRSLEEESRKRQRLLQHRSLPLSKGGTQLYEEIRTIIYIYISISLRDVLCETDNIKIRTES